MSRPTLHGYPVDAHLRDRRPAVTTPLRQAFPAWVRKVTGTA